MLAHTFIGEVFLSELVFLYFKASFKKFLSLVTSDGNVHGHLFISLNTETSDGVSGLGFDGLLVGQIF